MIFEELKRLDVVFDSPETPLASPPVFGGGDAVSGRVVLELSSPAALHALKLQAKGVAKVHFTEPWYLQPACTAEEEDAAEDDEENYTREYSDEEEYLIRSDTLLLPPGNRERIGSESENR